MKVFFEKKLKNRGETMVEVMVAFIILLIVLALFGTSITATGNAERHANEKRTEADTAMQQLQKKLHGGGTDAVAAGEKKSTDVQSKNLIATQYTTADGCVYWVFTNEE
ncbi:MAG: type II secretion system protein [Lachnospiraceae bacterium]|nr:type II secretion system protein [Lachnospiraceae bacterium]